MAGRRIAYGLILAAVLLFQITNDHYLAHLLLVMTLCLPVLSLLLSLPAMLTCRMSLSPQHPSTHRGSEARWVIRVRVRSPLPLPRLFVRLEETNLLTGKKTRKKLPPKVVDRNTPITQKANTEHCGLLELRVVRLRVYDYLGLFAFPLPRPQPARMVAAPIPADPGPLNLPEGWGIRPAPGSALRRSIGEDYDLREYRPGDPLRSVHWKLSSKWDDLIVREAADTAAPLLTLTFDRHGPPERLDKVLDRLAGYCRACLAVQRPHAVQWLDRDGQPVTCPVSDEKEFRACLLTILSAPAPAKAPAAHPEWETHTAGPALRIHVTPGEEDDHD